MRTRSISRRRPAALSAARARAVQALAVVAAVGMLAGCASSTGTTATPHIGAPAAGGTGTGAATTSPSAAPQGPAPTAAGALPTSKAPTATRSAAAIPSTPITSLPTATQLDVQRLVDPLTASLPANPANPVRFQREADPSTASRGLRSWVLSPFGPDLASFDQTAYGIHGEVSPRMLVAIGTPKRVDGVSAKYPDFVDGILRAAGATDLYSPALTTLHSSGYGLVITCGHDTLHGRTVCVWMGSTPGSHYPFIGVLVILSTVPTDKADQVAEQVLLAMTT